MTFILVVCLIECSRNVVLPFAVGPFYQDSQSGELVLPISLTPYCDLIIWVFDVQRCG